jgi:zinc transporter ZupT
VREELIILSIAVLGLFTGPVFLHLFKRQLGWIEKIHNGVMLCLICAVLVVLGPHCFEAAGYYIVIAAVIGFFFPFLLDLAMTRAHGLVLWFVVIGFLLHSALDGAALQLPDAEGGFMLTLAILIHRVPVGLMIYLSLSKGMGVKTGFFAVGLMAVSTCFGFVLGAPILTLLSEGQIALFTLFIIGALLHVVLHSQPFWHRIFKSHQH